MTTDPAALDTQRDALRERVRQYKRAILDARRLLQDAASELSELEAHAARLGLGLYRKPGVGGIHGHRSDPRS